MGKEKCPFSKIDCEECRLYRRGIKLVGLEKKPEQYATCVFNIIADNVEEMHRRVYMLQAEVGETKNANIFQALAILTDNAGAKAELEKIISKHFKYKDLLT